jgi:peptidoglycan/LPS O-acetylase OafA/YrhL
MISRAISLQDAWSSGRNNFNLIRLVAAWMVIYSHAWPITGTNGPDLVGWLCRTKSAGELAVDTFFLVSGFLVAASRERHSVKDFLAARALRILPALLVAVLLTTLVMGPLVTTDPHYLRSPITWSYLWRNASLWRAEFWLPGVFEHLPRTAVNGSLWTLPVEGRLYLLLLLAGLVGMLRPKRFFVAWSLAIAGAAGFAWWRAPLPDYLSELLWVTAFFITGTLAWVWRHRIRLSPWPLLALLPLAWMMRGTPLFAGAYFLFVAYGVLVLGFLARLPVLRRVDLSYGVYLYGWPMQQLAFVVGATSVLSNIMLATVLAGACAALSWNLIEYPALQLKSKNHEGAGRTFPSPLPKSRL